MLKLEFSTANSAFDDPIHESARILRAVARSIEQGRENGKCMDVNGNIVGKWDLTKD